jgi:excisionase family DNA binding protein
MTGKFNDNECLLNVEDVASYLNIPKSTIYLLCEKKIIPFMKIGKHWRCNKKILDAWLVEQIQKQDSV